MTDENAPPSAARKVWQRAWPLVGLAAAVLVNMLWIGALGYAAARLL